MRPWSLAGLVLVGVGGLSLANVLSPRARVQVLSVQQLRVFIPRNWIVSAHGIGTGQPSVTAIGPTPWGGHSKILEKLSVNAASSNTQVFSDQSLWPEGGHTSNGTVTAADPYSAQRLSRVDGQITLERTLRASNDSGYQVTLSGPVADRAHLWALWQAVRWPKVLTTTMAVHRYLATEHVKPYWLNRRNGWLLVQGEGEMGFAPLYLYRTTTGGKRWSYAAPKAPNQPFPMANSTYGGPAVAFQTPMRGWLAQINYVGSFIQLYKTSDGGERWTVLKRQILPPSPSSRGFPTPDGPVITTVRVHLPYLFYTWRQGPPGTRRIVRTRRIMLD